MQLTHQLCHSNDMSLSTCIKLVVLLIHLCGSLQVECQETNHETEVAPPVNWTFEPVSLDTQKSLLRVGQEHQLQVNATISRRNLQTLSIIDDHKVLSLILELTPRTLAPAGHKLFDITAGRYVKQDVSKEYFFGFDPDYDLNFTINTSVTLLGKFLGHGVIDLKLSAEIEPFNEDDPKIRQIDSRQYLVDVIRDQDTFDLIFQGFMVVFVSINYINMGCSMDLSSVVKCVRRPLGPVIGLITQFTVMPLASYLVGWWLFTEQLNLRLGLFTLGCCPGGSSSNFWTLLFDGDVDLSITMTLISTVAALGLMPMWLFTLGKTLSSDGNEIVIPFTNLILSLVSLTIPLGIGILAKYYLPKVAHIGQRIIKPFTIIVVLVIIIVTSFMYNHFYQMMTWKIVGAGALITIIGYGLGALAAWFFRLSKAQIIAISIETAFQNGGIAFVILLMSMRQPDSDISAVPPITQMLVTSQPLLIILIAIKIYEYYRKRKEGKKSNYDDGTEDGSGDITAIATFQSSNNNGSTAKCHVNEGIDAETAAAISHISPVKVTNQEMEIQNRIRRLDDCVLAECVDGPYILTSGIQKSTNL